MNLIVNVSENWAIGKGKSLLFHLSQDMKFFKSHTSGKTVVMGRKTLESLPGGNPLPNRKNIVLTRNSDYNPEGVTVYNSIKSFLADNEDNSDIYVIGGESLYRDLLPYCERAFVTKVDATVNDADAFMVNLDAHSDWEIEETSEELEEKGYTFRFVTYKKK
ncbi:MAG: dihydrofolate reductase [Clostridia bacterium]|nr:dihydrofolate reductase [Clostridia bacterium]